MALKARLFRYTKRLNECLVHDAAHVTPGSRGDHVARIQVALWIIDRLNILDNELRGQLYGPSTAKAVLAYKRKRKIINRAYESTEDNIVGKMTIASLDEEMLKKQVGTKPPTDRCYRITPYSNAGGPGRFDAQRGLRPSGKSG
jgi:hypothetical protein